MPGRSIRVAALLALALPAGASAEPVLFISIDGLRPAEVTEAEQRGLKLPNLRRFLAEGSYATGVSGVLPTLTYPSHTTLITGAAPARHGVVNNTTFDPMQINYGGWYWYASDVTGPTLWSAAHTKGLTTANVHWPVSVAAPGITWNLPQIWRTGHADDAKLVTALATPGLVAELEQRTGEAYAPGIDESVDGDANRGRFAEQLIAAHKPDFITVYLTGLDHEQHLNGPGTPAAHAALERIDAMVGRLIQAELAARPDAVIAVASDHGFAAIDKETNLFRAFIDEGLIRLDESGKVTGWDAMPWPSAGSAAVVLARKDDPALARRVRDLLDRLKAMPKTGIGAIAEAGEIAAEGGNPGAVFYLDFKIGTQAAGFAGAKAPLTGKPRYKGTHGYFPSHPEMQSTFMIMGHGVAKARSLGQIDMRAIAPTLAKVMGFSLEGAEKDPLAVASER